MEGLWIALAFFAFFSGAEVAFVSMDKVRFEVDKKSRLSHRILSYFLCHPSSFISTMLVGGVLSLVACGWSLAAFLADVLPAGIVANPFFLLLTQVLVAGAFVLLIRTPKVLKINREMPADTHATGHKSQ